MLVRVDKDWSFPDLNRQSPRSLGAWDGMQVTLEPVDRCDLLIVLNSPSRDIRVRCPVGNRWLFTQESPVPMYRWHTDSFRHFDKVFGFWDPTEFPNVVADQTALPWHIGKTYDELRALTFAESLGQKQDRVSWVTSNATHKPGHVLRMQLMQHLKSSGVEFDLFGRGFSPIDDKFDGIHPYRYSLAIENFSGDDYWTEKIADCFLSWTMPIYWGARNITSYFPERSMIRVDPADPAGAVDIIRRARAENAFEKYHAELAEARRLVLEKYQFFPHVRRLLDTHGAATNRRLEKTFIPTNPQHYAGETRVQQAKRLAKRLARLG